MIHDRLENWTQYFNFTPWRYVFEYLDSLSDASEESSHVSLLGNDIYATIMSYYTCLPEKSLLETHDEYIDIQMSLLNSEAINWFPRQSLEIKKPYDPKQDRTLYQNPVIAPVRVNNFPGFFTVLYPEDAHMLSETFRWEGHNRRLFGR